MRNLTEISLKNRALIWYFILVIVCLICSALAAEVLYLD